MDRLDVIGLLQLVVELLTLIWAILPHRRE